MTTKESGVTEPIRGPREKDRFRNHPTEWTGYIDPLPKCAIAEPFTEARPSVSEIKKAWPKHLADWAAKEAAKAAWKHRAVLVNMDEDEAIDLIAPASDRQRDRAAARGRDIHDILERLLHGGGIDIYDEASPVAEYLAVLRRIATDLMPEVVASEVIVVGPTWGGTFDAIWRIDGRLIIIDYKSRKLGKAATRYPEEGAQLGAYAAADYWIVEDADGCRRMEPLALDAGMIVSLAPDRYCLYDVDIGRAKSLWWSTVYFKQAQQQAPDMFGRPRGAKVEMPEPQPEPTPGVSHDFRTPEPEAWAPPDEGPLVADAVEKIKKACKDRGVDSTAIFTLNGWVREGNDSGRSWRITELASTRRYTIYRAVVRLLEVARSGDEIDGDIVRGLLSLALGEEVQPAMRIGMALGAMTTPEAKRLIEVCDALIAGTKAMTFDDAGRVLVVAA